MNSHYFLDVQLSIIFHRIGNLDGNEVDLFTHPINYGLTRIMLPLSMWKTHKIPY